MVYSFCPCYIFQCHGISIRLMSPVAVPAPLRMDHLHCNRTSTMDVWGNVRSSSRWGAGNGFRQRYGRVRCFASTCASEFVASSPSRQILRYSRVLSQNFWRSVICEVFKADWYRFLDCERICGMTPELRWVTAFLRASWWERRSLGGLLAMLVIWPFEKIKIMQQVRPASALTYQECFYSSNRVDTERTHSKIWNSFILHDVE